MICANCGLDNKPGASFCAGCGQPLGSSDASGLDVMGSDGSPTTVMDFANDPTKTNYAVGGYSAQAGFAQSQTPQANVGTSQPIGVDQVGNPIYAYDNAGNPIYGYDNAGNPIYGFDATGRPIFGYDAAGNAVMGFDQFGNPIVASNYSNPMANAGGNGAYQQPQQQKQGMSKGAIAGIIAAIAVAVIALIVVIVVVVMGGGSKASNTNSASENAGGNVSINVNVNSNEGTANKNATTSNTTNTNTNKTNTTTTTSGSTYNLTVTTAAGATLSGTVHRNSSGYVLSDSDTHEYTLSELRAKGLNDAELCIAWNEPYARQGRHFNNPQLQAYFQSCSWYHDSGYTGGVGSTASKNVENLKSLLTNSSWTSLKSS